MDIAILVDGLESTRQVHADGGRVLQDAASRVRIGSRGAVSAVFRDAQAREVLEGIAHSRLRCLVLASNSIRHADGDVARAVADNRDRIIEYLEAGGGLLLLHQFGGSIRDLPLPDGTAVRFGTLGSHERVDVEWANPRIASDDPLAHFPVEVGDPATQLSGDGQLKDKPAWLLLRDDLMPGFIPVISTRSGKTLVARTMDELSWRAVVSALPLDWHGSTGLLTNLMQFAATGRPRAIVWRDPRQSPGPIDEFLSLESSTTSYSPDGTDGLSEEWVLCQDALHVAVGDAQDLNIGKILRSGGAVVHGARYLDASASSGSQHPGSGDEGVPAPPAVEITAYVGGWSTRLRRDFAEALTAYGRSALSVSRDPFPIRNVLVAAAHFRESGLPFPDPRHVRAAIDGSVFPGMTLTSGLAVMQAMIVVDRPQSEQTALLRRLETLSTQLPASQVFLSACRAAIGLTGTDEFERRLSDLDSLQLSPPEALRALDWVGFLFFIRGHDPRDADQLAQSVRGLMNLALPAEEDGIWLSAEGSTSVLLAAASVDRMGRAGLPRDLVARTVLALRREYFRMAENPANVSALARAATGLDAAEQMMPLALDRLASLIVRSSDDPRMSDPSWGIDEAQRRVTVLAAESNQLRIELEDSRARERERRWIWLVGLVAAWLTIAFFLAGTLVGVARLVNLALASDFAPFVAGPTLLLLWLWLAVATLRGAARLGIVPAWGGRLAGAVQRQVRAARASIGS